MKRIKIALGGGAISMLITLGIAAADQTGSIDKGKAMFNDPKLGTNGKTCNDCHLNGKGLENAASKQNLEQILNGCITQGLKGKPLDVKSPEMESLVSYVKSFSGAKKQGKKAAVGC